MRHTSPQPSARRICGAAFAALLLLLSSTAQAGRGHDHDRGRGKGHGHGHSHSHSHGHDRRHGGEEWARVTHVEPIYRTVTVTTPQRECWTEEVHHAGHSGSGGTIIGTIIGGVIGHQVGRRIDRGRGRHAATVAGAVIGAAVGHQRDSRHSSGGYVSHEERCRTHTVSHTEERIDGYRVSYRYRGRHYTTHSDEHPGKRIRVRVQVTPLVY